MYDDKTHYRKLQTMIQNDVPSKMAQKEMLSLLRCLIDEDDLGGLVSGLERQYRRGVDLHVEAIEDEAPYESREQLIERVDEAADGSQWVIYTHKAKIVCLVSDSMDAYRDITDEPRDESFRAYFALRSDIREELLRRHGDYEEELVE